MQFHENVKCAHKNCFFIFSINLVSGLGKIQILDLYFVRKFHNCDVLRGTRKIT